MTAAESVNSDTNAKGAINVSGWGIILVPQVITETTSRIYAKAAKPLTTGFLLIALIIPLWLRVPSFALTTALSQVLKAFQNPIWAELARERLKQIRMLTKMAII